MFYIAQSFGIIALVVLIMSFQKNKKEIANEIKKIYNYEVAEISSFEIKNSSKEFLCWIEENIK